MSPKNLCERSKINYYMLARFILRKKPPYKGPSENVVKVLFIYQEHLSPTVVITDIAKLEGCKNTFA